MTRLPPRSPYQLTAKAQLAAIERKVKEVDPHPQVSLRVNFAFLTSREIRRLEIDTELVKNLKLDGRLSSLRDELVLLLDTINIGDTLYTLGI